jgi:hypothetical protein
VPQAVVAKSTVDKMTIALPLLENLPLVIINLFLLKILFANQQMIG